MMPNWRNRLLRSLRTRVLTPRNLASQAQTSLPRVVSSRSLDRRVTSICSIKQNKETKRLSCFPQQSMGSRENWPARHAKWDMPFWSMQWLGSWVSPNLPLRKNEVFFIFRNNLFRLSFLWFTIKLTNTLMSICGGIMKVIICGIFGSLFWLVCIIIMKSSMRHQTMAPRDEDYPAVIGPKIFIGNLKKQVRPPILRSASSRSMSSSPCMAQLSMRLFT